MEDNTKKKLIKICNQCNIKHTYTYKNYCRNCYILKKRTQSGLIKCQCKPECLDMIYALDSNLRLARYKQNHGLHGQNHPLWKGGRIYDDDNYVMIWSPNHPNRDHYGYVREHRLVIETYIGRYLNECEVIHHKNGIKDDNRIENLELIQSQSIHAQNHMIGTSHAKKDMSGRVCLKCNSIKTHIDKNGWAHWSKFDNGFLCHSCDNRLKYQRKKSQNL